MDLSFETTEGNFQVRACAVIINKDKLLVTSGSNSPYYYLAGGKVKFGESAQQALTREIREETGVNCSIVRPLWLVQNFFAEKERQVFFHEIGLYFLAALPEDCELLAKDSFTFCDSAGGKRLNYRWVDLSMLKELKFYPEFIKESINNLPDSLTIIT